MTRWQRVVEACAKSYPLFCVFMAGCFFGYFVHYPPGIWTFPLVVFWAGMSVIAAKRGYKASLATHEELKAKLTEVGAIQVQFEGLRVESKKHLEDLKQMVQELQEREGIVLHPPEEEPPKSIDWKSRLN